MKEKIKLSIFWIFAFLVIIFMMAFSSQAASPFFPMSQNKNSHFSGAISLIESTFDSDNNYYFVIYRGQNLSLMTDYAYIVYFPKSSGTPSLYGEIGNQNSQFSLYKIGNVEFTYKSFDIYWQGGTTPVIRNISVLNNTDVMWRTFYSSNYDSGYDYISNFRVYTDNSPDKEIILNFIGGNEYDDPGNDTFPNNADKPDINDYIDYNDFPSFDSSDGIGSFWEIVKYSFGVVIPGLGNYIVDSMNWGFQKVINNIRNVVKNVGTELQEAVNDFSDTVNGFLSDIKDFVSDIKNNIEYLVEPLDSDIIYDNISTTSLVSNVNSIKSSLTSFQAAFTGVSEPSSYTIPIHLENLPSNWFGIQTTQYIDLGVINGSVKEGLRLFVWAMVTYGLVVTIFDSISNYINGGGDET